MGEFVELTAADGHKFAAYVAGPADATKGLVGCNTTYEFTPMKHHAIEVGDLTTYEYAKVDGRLTLVQTNL